MASFTFTIAGCEACCDPCSPYYDLDLDVTLTGLTVNNIPCFEFGGVDSLHWTSLTDINGAHTLTHVTAGPAHYWELTGVGSVGYTFYENRTDCFDTGGNVTMGTTGVTFRIFCSVDAGSGDLLFSIEVMIVPFTVGGNTVSGQYVFYGIGVLGATLSNSFANCCADGTAVIAVA